MLPIWLPLAVAVVCSFASVEYSVSALDVRASRLAQAAYFPSELAQVAPGTRLRCRVCDDIEDDVALVGVVAAPASAAGTLHLVYYLASALSEDADSFGFVARSSSRKEYYVVFKGTSSSAEWVNNVDHQMESYNYDLEACVWCSGGSFKVHTGFGRTYASLVPLVDDMIVAGGGVQAGYRLVVIGHSLGMVLCRCALAAQLFVDSRRAQAVLSRIYSLCTWRGKADVSTI
jgi:hypothetical protein